MLQSETTYQSPSAPAVPVSKACNTEAAEQLVRPPVTFSTGVFYTSFTRWHGGCCCVPPRILSVAGKHFRTLWPFTLCLICILSLWQQCSILPLVSLPVNLESTSFHIWVHGIVFVLFFFLGGWLIERYFYFRITESLYSLSVGYAWT